MEKNNAVKRLYLSDADKKIAGVCGGLGEYYEKDSTLFRVLFVLLFFVTGGLAIFAYLGMWAIIPRRPKTGPANDAPPV
jgi:phage shock protein C